MNGLECSEIMLSKCKNIIDFRIDSNTYKKYYMYVEELLKNKKAIILEKYILSIQNFGAYSLCNYINFLDSGIPFLMTQNVRKNYIDYDGVKYIDEATHLLLWKSHCFYKNVLITMAGEYLGRAAVYENDEVISSNQAIAKLRLKNENESYWISTFINTKYGQAQINRLKTITGQPNINMSIIKTLLVPIASKKIIDKVSSVVIMSSEYRACTKKIYSEAEQILLKSLNMDNFVPSQKNTTTKLLSQFMNAGRLDAEYFQPKYDDIENKIELLLNDKKNGCFTVNNIISESNRVIKIEDKKEYKYIELSDIDNYGNVTDCTIDIGINLPSRARKEVYTGDVIVSSLEGSLQKCAIITETFNGALVSTGFHVVKSDEINSETLLLLFKSWFMQELMRKHSTGAIMAATSDDSFKKILLPVVKLDVQEMIANKIQKSFELRAKSNELLEAAKRAVEIAIEKNEETAMQYLAQFECVGKEV